MISFMHPVATNGNGESNKHARLLRRKLPNTLLSRGGDGGHETNYTQLESAGNKYKKAVIPPVHSSGCSAASEMVNINVRTIHLIWQFHSQVLSVMLHLFHNEIQLLRLSIAGIYLDSLQLPLPHLAG